MRDPWIVSVLSTGYDLEEYRKELIAMLKEKKFEVSAYELPEFPVEHDMYSHDSCLVALQRVDIALVIIAKRSGGIYYGIDDSKKKFSITEAEYLEAIKRGIPVFVFVKKESKDELYGYKKEFNDYCKKNNISQARKEVQAEFDKGYICKYVEKVDTLHFIDDVQKVYSEYAVSNWMDFFDDIENLKECVEGKLTGYSRALIQKLAEKQREVLLNMHTSTSIGMSLRDVFTSNYYIEPPHKVESGNGLIDENADELSKAIEKILPTDNSVLIYGEAGYGKTTTIAKCFVDHVNAVKSKPSYTIPLFLPLRNKGNDYGFDLKEYINEELKDLLKKDEYPYLNIKDLRLRFYCDGFDELAESLSERDIDRIRNSQIFKYPLLLTCRQQFVTRYLNVHNFSDVFGARIKMLKWDPDTVERYVVNFCEKKRIEEIKKNRILFAIREIQDIQQLIDSPLLITMFLWFLENEDVEKDIYNISRVKLFRSWMNELAGREHSKNNLLSSKSILDIWKFVAWHVYLSRRNNEKLMKEDLLELIDDLPLDVNADIALVTLDALFEWKSDCINGTFHEQFMEYLVADFLIDACAEEKDPYPLFLQQVLRPEINRYFRGIWKEESKNKKEKIYSAISKQYFDNAGKAEADLIATRVHAIYHLCRLDSDKRSECIERAFNLEKNISVLLSLYFGAIKLGNIDKEEEFYQLLQKEEYSKANRGYHLTYYADIIPDGTLPYKDDGISDWQGTLKAMERHFGNNDSDHFFLRRIDLFTMKELVIAREKVAPLTKEILDVIGESIDSYKLLYNQNYRMLNVKIKKEYCELAKVYEKYCLEEDNDTEKNNY